LYEAKNVARKNKATIFGIQDNGQLFISNEPLDTALKKAKNTGSTECSNELGSSWINQVYALQPGSYSGSTYYGNGGNEGNNCFLYNDGTFVEGDNATTSVPLEQYYVEKLTDIFDKIQSLLGESDNDLQTEYNKLIQELNTSNNIEIVKKITAQKNQLMKFAKQNNLIDEQYNNSIEKLREENIVFRVWVFVLLFILFLIFQLFKNPLKSISYVCLFFMITIIITIIKLLNPLIFMIILLFLFLSTVLVLFYKENYPLSIGILIVGSIIFALVYRL
jgi:hypothetical protein